MVAVPLAEHHTPTPPVHTEAADSLIARLRTDASSGLSESEAARRLAQDGPNSLPQPKGKSALVRLLEQFANPIVLTLLAAAVIALVDGMSRVGQPMLGRFGDAIAILLIVVINAVLGFYQERRAEAALDALQKMQTPERARAARRCGPGRRCDLPGRRATSSSSRRATPCRPTRASCRRSTSSRKRAALTGESVPVEKDARAAVADDAPLGDRATMLFIGTTIVRGKGARGRRRDRAPDRARHARRR